MTAIKISNGNGNSKGNSKGNGNGNGNSRPFAFAQDDN